MVTLRLLASRDAYLRSSPVVDFEHPEVRALAARLALDASSSRDLIRRCYEWVRDEVRHSSDHRMNPLTSRASDVLTHRTGYCYAKSHLLAALLRANGIPTGFCYQRLSVDGDGAPFCLHGLNAVWVDDVGWLRVDARGNRHDVHAEFDPPHEKLAFDTRVPGEADLPEVHAEPLAIVLDALARFDDWAVFLENLPDVPL